MSNRDFFSSKKVKTCRIHDVMLEVIVGVSIEQNFVSLQGGQYIMTSHDKVRRLSLHGNGAIANFGTTLYTLSTSLELSHVRSLSSFGDTPEVIRFSEARFFRVLDLESCEFLRNRYLKQICAMFKLRGCLVPQNFCTVPVTSNLRTRAWSIKCKRKSS